MEAADYRKAGIFAKRVDAAVGYGATPAVTALHQVGGILARIGTEYANKRQYAEAKKYLNAEFVLGLRLYEERMTRQQLSAAMGLMAHAATVLGQIAVYQDEKALKLKLDDYLKAQRTFTVDQIEPMARVITSVDPSVHPKHIGDVFVIARERIRFFRLLGAIKFPDVLDSRVGERVGVGCRATQ